MERENLFQETERMERGINLVSIPLKQNSLQKNLQKYLLKNLNYRISKNVGKRKLLMNISDLMILEEWGQRRL